MDEQSDPAGNLDRGTPRLPIRVEQALAAFCMALLCVITFANVAVRYLTDISFAFTEEYSVALMVIMTFFGAGAAFAADRHIRMTVLVERLGLVRRRRVEQAVMALSLLAFGMIAVYGVRLAWDDWRYEITSPGLGVAQWLYTVWLPLLSFAVCARILGRMIRLARAD